MNIVKSSNIKQQGFVSIIVAATVMILLSLVTIGFTRVMQREQREALDRQLTRQATYAAESGINATRQYLEVDNTQEAKNQCASTTGNVYQEDNNGDVFDLDPSPGPAVTPSPFFDGDDASNSSIQVTCVLYDKTPTEVTNTMGVNDEAVYPFEDKDDDNFNEILVTWRGDASGFDSDCGDAENFVFPSTMSGYPILKLDLYNTDSLSRSGLAGESKFFYLIPCDSGVADIFLDSRDGRSIHKESVICDEGICQVTLNVSDLGTSKFFVRQKLLYGSGTVILSATKDTGDPSQFRNAQTVIDVTARATDVVRRLRVYVPYSSVSNLPGAVVTVGSGDLCKDIAIIDGVQITNGCPSP